MKKLLSLLLALTMLFTMVTAATAESTATPFSFTLDTYKTTFDQMITSSLGVTVVWVDANNSAIAAADGIPALVVEADANGCVTALVLDHQVSVANASDAANVFGQMISLSAMTALMLEDANFLSTGMTEFLEKEVDLVTSVSSGAESVPAGSLYTEDRVVCGTTCTMSMGYTDESKTGIRLVFTMVNGGVEEEPAEEEVSVELADAFNFTVSDYRTYFDSIVSSAGLTAEWIETEQATVIAIPNYPLIYVTTDASGAVTGILTGAEMDSSDSDASNIFGQAISYASIPALLLADPDFANNMGTFISSLTSLLLEAANALETVETGEMAEVSDVVSGGYVTIGMGMTEAGQIEMAFYLLPIK